MRETEGERESFVSLCLLCELVVGSRSAVVVAAVGTCEGVCVVVMKGSGAVGAIEQLGCGVVCVCGVCVESNWE